MESIGRAATSPEQGQATEMTVIFIAEAGMAVSAVA